MKQTTESRIGRGFNGEERPACELGDIANAESQFADDPEAASAATFEGPEEIGIGAGVGDADLAVGSDDFGFEQSRRGGAVMLGEAAETSALDEAGDSDGGAASTLYVLTGFGGDGVVSVQPDDAGADGNGGLRLVVRASLGDKGVVQSDVVEVARPDEKRIGRVGGALVAVAATFDDEAEMIFACEIYGSGDILSIARGDRINTGFGGPGIGPSHGLGEGGGVSDEEGVAEVLEEFLTLRSGGRGLTFSEGELDRDEIAADLLLELVPG